jgi:signal transduction histidine kinase
MVSGGLKKLADEKNVSLKVESIDGPELDNRSAHLVALILENLVQNAIEASAADGAVLLRAGGDGREFIQFEVMDKGPGFPAGQSPFEPCRSTKEGGSGIGLALCRQLANHLGARLELEREYDIGCRFVLQLSTGALSKETEEAPETLRR